MTKLQRGDRVTVYRPDGYEAEYGGRFCWQEGPVVFVMPDGTDDADPVLVEADRVHPEDGPADGNSDPGPAREQ